MNRENLLRLADYLETLPADYKHFNMGSYFDNFDDDSVYFQERDYALHNGGVGSCGTTACAVGHGPAAGVLVPEDLVEPFMSTDWEGTQVQKFNVDWEEYSFRYFIDATIHWKEWSWCFGGAWASHDNTPLGAAKRIRYLLRFGLPDTYIAFDNSVDHEAMITLYTSLEEELSA